MNNKPLKVKLNIKIGSIIINNPFNYKSISTDNDSLMGSIVSINSIDYNCNMLLGGVDILPKN
jgi:hypothetical protein